MTVTQASSIRFPIDFSILSPSDIWNMPYPNFVATVNQTNVMPGAFTTLSRWAKYSDLKQDSRLLEVACTTGFASRELALMTGCSAVGFDLSPIAPQMASFNHQMEAPTSDLTYLQADGYNFNTDRPFTHIVIGSALGFFNDPAAMAKKLASLLVDGGYLLATAFYCPRPMPEDVLAVRQSVFGIYSAPETYKEAMAHFEGFDVMYEHRSELLLESESEINHYCESTIKRLSEQAGVLNPALLQAMKERLRLVRQTTNKLREHQHYAVLVLRYRAAQFPRRYVELF